MAEHTATQDDTAQPDQAYHLQINSIINQLLRLLFKSGPLFRITI